MKEESLSGYPKKIEPKLSSLSEKENSETLAR
jgi:hypothetical protein